MYYILASDYNKLPIEMRGGLRGIHTIQMGDDRLVEGVHFQFVPEGVKHSKLQVCRGCGQIKIIYSRDLCRLCYERYRRHKNDSGWDERSRDRYLQNMMKESMSRLTNVDREKYPDNIVLALKRYGDGIPDEVDKDYIAKLKKTMRQVLTLEQMEVFDLRFKRRLSAVETSRILNCSRQNIQQHVNNGLQAIYQAMTDTETGAYQDVRLRKELLELPVTQLCISRQLTKRLLSMGITTVAQVQRLVNARDGEKRYDLRPSTLNKYRMALRVLADTMTAGDQEQKVSGRKKGTRSSDSVHAKSI